MLELGPVDGCITGLELGKDDGIKDGLLDELGVWLGRVVGSFDNDGFSLGYFNQQKGESKI